MYTCVNILDCSGSVTFPDLFWKFQSSWKIPTPSLTSDWDGTFGNMAHRCSFSLSQHLAQCRWLSSCLITFQVWIMSPVLANCWIDPRCGWLGVSFHYLCQISHRIVSKPHNLDIWHILKKQRGSKRWHDRKQSIKMYFKEVSCSQINIFLSFFFNNFIFCNPSSETCPEKKWKLGTLTTIEKEKVLTALSRTCFSSPSNPFTCVGRYIDGVQNWYL